MTAAFGKVRAAGLWAAAAAWATAAACGGAAPKEKNDVDDAAMRKRLNAMVDTQIQARGVADAATLAAMRKVPRWEFVPADFRSRAFEDNPLPIGDGQTISQPYIVAYMTEALMLKPGDRVLEIGTGSGYQAAVLAEIVAEVYTIEILPDLAAGAESTLARLGYGNVHVRCGDGYEGWPEAAPFDAIIGTCAPERVPQPLFDQLKEGGRLVFPVAGCYPQMLRRYTKRGGELVPEDLQPVMFVPMTGKAQDDNP